jgi:hypothetical protein
MDRAVHLAESLTLSKSIGLKKTQRGLEKRPILLAVVIAITLGSPFLGFLVSGWPGVIAGVLFGALSFYLGLLAITKVEKIETITITERRG